MSETPGFLRTGGEMARRIAAHDWAPSFGKPSAWPDQLKSLVGLMVVSSHPMFIAWGPGQIWLYNDAFIPIMGRKHPDALGRHALEEVWSEAREVLAPLFDRVFSGESVQMDDFALELDRRGKMQEAHFAFSYTPIRNDNGSVVGLYGVCIETTEQIVSQRLLEAARLRQTKIFEQAPAFIIVMEGPDHTVEFVNDAHRRLFNSHDWIGKTIREAFPSISGQGFFDTLDTVYQKQETYEAESAEIRFRRSAEAEEETRYLTFIYSPILNNHGETTGIFCEGFDVTEARQARDEIRASENRLRLATEAAAIGTWDFNPVTGELRWDERCKALFGLSADAKVSYDSAFLAGLHPADRERAHAAVQASLSPEGSSRYDLEYRTVGIEDGVERWIAATGDAIFENKKAVRFIGTVRDITEQKRAEQRFEVLNRTAALVAADLNIDRIVQSITDAGVELTGAQFGAFFYNVQDAQGEWYTLYALSGVPREAFSSFPMPRNTAIFAPTFSGEAVVRSDDIRLDPRYGHTEPHRGMPKGHLPVRSYLAVPVMSRSGDVIGGLFFGHAEAARFGAEHEEVVLGMAAQAATAIDNGRLLQATQRELIERRRIESELTRNEARLRFLDTLGRETAATEDADAILAITTRLLGEHLGVDICAYADMEPDQDAFTIRGDWSRPGVPSIVGTYSLATFGELAVANLHDGKPLIINDNIKEIGEDQSAMFLQIGIRATICMPFIKQGALTALMAIHHAEPHNWTPEELALLSEVTERSWAHIERVRSAAALKELNATLEQRVDHEVTQRSKTEALLRQAQKMEAIGQLTGGIAHDFNNLLGAIGGSFSLIERRILDNKPGADRYIKAGQEAVKRAANLTQRLLAFSRRQTLDPKPTDANKLVAGMEDLIRRTVGPNIEVEVVGAGGLWSIKVDSSQLESALLNLCINARDAMMPAGGRLTIETANKWLDDRAARERDLTPGQYISVCVTDTGTGMAPDVIERAFDPFFTTKPIGQGTGLGLSMVYGFVRQSGGQVRIYSEMGKGTTMCLYLPRFAGRVEEARELVDESAPIPGEGETILVVDDEPTLRMLITDVLEDNGYIVVAVGDGAAAIQILRSERRIDLLLTDVGLPGGMNGRQVADAARAQRPGLKCLFITGYAENAVIGNGDLEPGMEILTKPFEISGLAAKVRALLDN